MPRAYASETTVSEPQTRAQIETLLAEHDCDQFGYLRDTSGPDARSMLQFRIRRADGSSVAVRMTLPLPKRSEFTHSEKQRRRRTDKQIETAYQQACRARWRQLYLVIKAKLEAVRVGISTIEREFLADVVLPDGETVGERIDRDYGALLGGSALRQLPPGGE